MPPLIVRDPELTFVFTPDATPVPVDLSCYTIAVEVTSDPETVDVGTFCNPNASEIGRVSETIVCAFLWEDALYTALQPHIGEELELQFMPSAAGTKAILCRARYASLPWGRFEINQRVEADLTLAALSTVTYAVPTP